MESPHVTHTPTDLVDHTIGPYRLERLLGQGGFAWVFVGREADGTPVAVKVLKPRYAGDPQFESRFRHESETAAKLEHPNIIRMLARAGPGPRRRPASRLLRPRRYAVQGGDGRGALHVDRLVRAGAHARREAAPVTPQEAAGADEALRAGGDEVSRQTPRRPLRRRGGAARRSPRLRGAPARHG